MTKRHTTISVDDELLKKAKANFINISAEVERMLRSKLTPTKKDLPDEAILIKCTQCYTIIKYGFFCEERGLFLCQKCQDGFNMNTCPFDKIGEHHHIRIPGLDDQRKEELNNVPQRKKTGK